MRDLVVNFVLFSVKKVTSTFAVFVEFVATQEGFFSSSTLFVITPFNFTAFSDTNSRFKAAINYTLVFE